MKSFLQNEEKANVIPKPKINNYRPVSLLPVSSKISEKLLYDRTFKFFTENNLIWQNQSGFKQGDSCTNQLLSVTRQIYKSVSDVHETRSVVLDMSKAFDKVWHKDLILKLKQNGISGNFLSTLTEFLTIRKQRVVLNGQLSSWSNIEPSIPQGSLLGPVLLFVYINNFSDSPLRNTRLSAENVSFFSVVNDIK